MPTRILLNAAAPLPHRQAQVPACSAAMPPKSTRKNVFPAQYAQRWPQLKNPHKRPTPLSSVCCAAALLPAQPPRSHPARKPGSPTAHTQAGAAIGSTLASRLLPAHIRSSREPASRKVFWGAACPCPALPPAARFSLSASRASRWVFSRFFWAVFHIFRGVLLGFCWLFLLLFAWFSAFCVVF